MSREESDSKPNMTTSVTVKRISELVNTLKSGRTKESSTSEQLTEQLTEQQLAEQQLTEQVIQKTVLPPSAADTIHLPIATPTRAQATVQAVSQTTPITANATFAQEPNESNKLQSSQELKPLNAGKRQKTSSRKNTKESGRRRKASSTRRTELRDKMEVILDNQMRITQALALKIPAVVRCAQTLPSHRWPGGMRVNRPDARDMPEGSFTWYDGFNVYATETDATSKQFSNEKLKRTQVKNAKYPENTDDDDDDNQDTKTFVHKRAWP